MSDTVNHHYHKNVAGLGEETIKKVLKDSGLTEKEAEVYIFLAKHDALRGGEIARLMRKDKAQVFRFLKNLQRKGLVEATLEFPTRFTAVPFEAVIESSIKAKREEAAFIEQAKKDLLSYLQKKRQEELEPSLEKFVVIEGNKKIFSKITQMITETKHRLSAMSTVPTLVRANQFGILDAAFNHPLKSKIQFRFLTELDSQNLKAMKTILKRAPKAEFNFKGRNPDLGLRLFPRMIIRDDEEIIFFIKSSTAILAEKDDTCLWTNCKSLVQAFTAVFEDLWRNSTDIQTKIVEIETGKPIPEIRIIKDAEAAHKKYVETMCSAEKEIIMLTSSEGVSRARKTMQFLKERAERGVSIRIMAPITADNLTAAQELSKYCAVRHAPASYLGTTIIDGKHLFQFKTPPLYEEKPQALAYFENTFYTNDLAYAEKMTNMLNDVWKSAYVPSTITVESIIRPPTPTVVPLSENEYVMSRPDSPYRKTSFPIEEKPGIGIVTEKDVLTKIINAKKYPPKNWPKDITRYYGSTAQAVIHPPDFFNLPDMIIVVFHYEKKSSFGAEDLLMVLLWLETPQGHAYVPVAVVGDNPQSLEYRKAVYAGTPAGQNCYLVKKDEFQVQIHGSTLFAGWTVPIPLSSRYILPPACILFEGYSKVKPVVVSWRLPSGVKITTEGNGLEAFVTFFHPSSKYAGPGTDGTIGRDVFTTHYPPQAAG